MSNTLGLYNPLFYANEALIILYKALGFAGRVHLGYDAERRAFGLGNTIEIRRPTTFVAQDAPSTAQDLNPDTVAITLNKWKEVKFKLTDQELAFTQDRIITEHIAPAAYAIADQIDQDGVALYKDVPWWVDAQSTAAPQDITNVRQNMFDRNVPLNDPTKLHLMVNGAMENGLLQNLAFSQFQGAGPTAVDTQLRGSLGPKFGMELFANQNTPTHTAGTCSVTALTLTNAQVKGDTILTSISAVSVTGTLVPGDVIQIAGNTQQYAITTATYTAASNAFTNVTITPPLVQAYSSSTSITLTTKTHVANLGFHQHAFALATAPLSDLGSQLGAKIASVQDPVTGLSIRSRMFYVGDTSTVYVALDVLYGWKTLNPNLAVRLRK